MSSALTGHAGIKVQLVTLLQIMLDCNSTMRCVCVCGMHVCKCACACVHVYLISHPLVLSVLGMSLMEESARIRTAGNELEQQKRLKSFRNQTCVNEEYFREEVRGYR